MSAVLEPEAPPRAEPRSRPDPAAGIGRTVLAMIQTRLELLQEELLEERDTVMAQIRLAVIAWTAANLAGVGAIVWVAIALPPGPLRIWLLGLIVVLLAGFAIWSVQLIKRQRQETGKPMRRFLEQLSRDGEMLRDRDRAGSPS